VEILILFQKIITKTSLFLLSFLQN